MGLRFRNYALNTINRSAILRLKVQWTVLALASAALLFSASALLLSTPFAPYVTRWLLISVIVLGGILGTLWRLLPRNRAPGKTILYPTLGAATWLTILGGTLIAMLAGFLFSPRYAGWLAWIPALLYLSTRIIDLLDGYIARVTNHVSETGAALDIELDGLGLLVAVLLAVQYGQLPTWYVLLAISRPLFVLGIWWRRRMGKTVAAMPPSKYRRVIAGCQMGFVAVVLWPIANPELLHIAAIFFAIPLIASFSRDWLVVSNALPVDSQRYGRLHNAMIRLVVEWFPFVSRLLVALAMGALVWNDSYGSDVSFTNQLNTLTPMLLTVAVLFIFGIAARTASVVLILAVLVYPPIIIVGWSADAVLIVVLAATTLVLHVGSGRFSIWSPEERIVHGQLGKASG